MARLTYASILTRSLDRLAEFYREVLQADPQWTGPYAEFSTPPGMVGLWSIDAYAEVAGAAAVPQLGSGGIMLEFEVDDVDAEFARLGRLSKFDISFIIPPTTLPWGNRSIYFRDPDGNLINLFSRVNPQSRATEAGAAGRQ
jgi:catechol 2,3-dioxygenase-like lactoylglutathione lyase family enzyme